MKVRVVSSSLSVCRYILQSKESGAPGFSVMAWSSFLAGGNRCAACSLKTFQCCWYAGGISPFVSSLSAGALRVVAQTCGVGECFVWYPAVCMVMSSPCSWFMVQSMDGLNILNHGYPRTMRSHPRFAM